MSLLINLEDIRPQNESQEHFFLKQVGRAYLFRQGIRCIATEVSDMKGKDEPPFGSRKIIMDVVGVDKRSKPNKKAVALYEKITKKALIIGKKQRLTITNRNGETEFPFTYTIKDAAERLAVENGIRLCYEEACVSLGYHKRLHKELRFYREETHEMRGIEVKVSYADFKNGFSMLPEYTYLLAPIGIVPKEELPKKVGLLEFDFDAYHRFVEKGEKEAWFAALKVTKRAKKTFDSRFIEEKNGKNYVNDDAHRLFCEQLLYIIAQQNSEEHVFWNPHLFHAHPPVFSTRMKERFLLDVGQQTPLGILAEKKLGKYTFSEEEWHDLPKRYGYVHHKDMSYMPYYRLLNENGYTKWLPDIQIDRHIQEKVREMEQRLAKADTSSDICLLYSEALTSGLIFRDKKSDDTVSLETLLQKKERGTWSPDSMVCCLANKNR